MEFSIDDKIKGILHSYFNYPRLDLTIAPGHFMGIWDGHILTIEKVIPLLDYFKIEQIIVSLNEEELKFGEIYVLFNQLKTAYESINKRSFTREVERPIQVYSERN
jgi:hypothetical protein